MDTDLDRLRRLQGLLRRNPHLSLPQQLLGKVRDVSPSDGDVLNAAANDVAFSLEHKRRFRVENEDTVKKTSLN